MKVESRREKNSPGNHQFLVKIKKGIKGEVYYFKCLKYIDGKCSIYKERPQVCSGYPLYFGLDSMNAFFPIGRNCGYKKYYEIYRLKKVLEKIKKLKCEKKEQIGLLYNEKE